MTKLEILLIKIETLADFSLNLADFGLYEHQIKLLVDKINHNTNIKKLNLKHNSLTDGCIPELVKLQNIQSLNISYNDFTQKGINILKEALKAKFARFSIFAEHNNANPFFFTTVDSIETILVEKTEVVDAPTIDIYNSELIGAIRDKLSKFALTAEQSQLLKEKFIELLNNDKVFENISKKTLAERPTM
jgi:hypothetical protein